MAIELHLTFHLTINGDRPIKHFRKDLPADNYILH